MGCILYVAGGAMSGVFSAGVLQALREHDIHERIDAVYGISAGAFNAVHFATDTIGCASEWYCRHVQEKQIVRSTNPLKMLYGEPLIDMERAEQVMLEEQVIDVPRLVASRLPVFVGVVDSQTKQFRFLDARRPDAVRLLRASATLTPLAGEPVMVDKRPYVDGALAESICLAKLRELHPGSRIIIIINHRPSFSIWRLVANFLLRRKDPGLASLWYASLDKEKEEYAQALTADDVLLIEPERKNPLEMTTLDANELKEGFSAGYEWTNSNIERINLFIDDFFSFPSAASETIDEKKSNASA